MREWYPAVVGTATATATERRGDSIRAERRCRRSRWRSCRRGNESERDGRRRSGNDRIWERRMATEWEWPKLRLCRRRRPNNRRVSFSHLISSMWFLGCVLEKWNNLFSVSYVLFFFFGCNVELRFFEQKWWAFSVLLKSVSIHRNRF